MCDARLTPNLLLDLVIRWHGYTNKETLANSYINKETIMATSHNKVVANHNYKIMSRQNYYIRYTVASQLSYSIYSGEYAAGSPKSVICTHEYIYTSQCRKHIYSS